MATTYVSILLHVIFSTKLRAPLITPSIEPDLHAYIGGVCKSNSCVLLAANGTTDHVHLLISLGKTVSISELMLQVKRDSSTWIKSQGQEFAGFRWQEGYGAFSIGQSQVDAVRRYIAGQKEHHKTVPFRDELIEFLRRYEIPFEERYLD
ncbi:MAG: IS200/IS605 family transposase [Planctomycetota bacterium]|nr:MAG: IS200/IS605 family transposase [Planctomycetota bacterium]